MPNIQIPKQYQDLIGLSRDKPLTTSVVVAEKFNKRHNHVLRDIEYLECSDEFKQANFFEAEYLDAQGKPRKSYNMTHDGFLILAMGFTGKEAMLWKEKFIEAFNWMRNELEVQYKKDFHWARMAFVDHELADPQRRLRAAVSTYEKRETAALSLITWMRVHIDTCTCKPAKQAKKRWEEVFKDRDVTSMFIGKYSSDLEEILKIMDTLKQDRNAII